MPAFGPVGSKAARRPAESNVLALVPSANLQGREQGFSYQRWYTAIYSIKLNSNFPGPAGSYRVPGIYIRDDRCAHGGCAASESLIDRT